MRGKKLGFTLLELMIVIASISIVGAISVVNIRDMLRAEQVRGVATAFQQILWQAGSSASARLEPVILSFTDNAFVLQTQDTKTVLRREQFPELVQSSFPNNKSLTFLPSGRIDETSYSNVSQPVQITNTALTYSVSFSLIGESKLVVSQ